LSKCHKLSWKYNPPRVLFSWHLPVYLLTPKKRMTQTFVFETKKNVRYIIKKDACI
jgi:hypothetical protein